MHVNSTNINTKTVSQYRGTYKTHLDTLAQLTDGNKGKDKKSAKTDGKAVFLKRARSKYYSLKVVYGLLQLNSPLHKQYQRAYYCSNTLSARKPGQLIADKYCNSRACNICNRIRTAKLMNGYINQLGDINELKFGTLTAGKRVTCDELPKRIDEMISSFRLIINKKLRYMHGRKGGVKWSGVRKIEVTYCHKTNTYHPHIHFIGGQYSDIIIQEWLKLFPNASHKAQDLRTADKNSLNELFKYSTKQLSRTKGNNMQIDICPVALDVIFRALDKRRTFQPYGIIKAVNEEVGEEENSQHYENLPCTDAIYWTYNYDVYDWINIHGECLTGYKPPAVTFNYIEVTEKVTDE
jgi:hypothetical protein